MKMMQVILVLGVIAVANARQSPPSAPTPSSKTEKAQPPVQMRAIVNALAGTWSITWLDKEGRAIGAGEEVWRSAPGGSAFIEENRSMVNGEPADDYAAMWWDSKAQQIRGIWCDASINDEGCSGFDVGLESDNVVLTGQWEYHGKRQVWREVFSGTGTVMKQMLYIGEPGKELMLSGTIRGVKR